MNKNVITIEEKIEIIDYLKENLIILTLCENNSIWLYYKDEITNFNFPKDISKGIEYTTIPKLTHTTNKNIIDKYSKRAWNSILAETAIQKNNLIHLPNKKIIINFLIGFDLNKDEAEEIYNSVIQKND